MWLASDNLFSFFKYNNGYTEIGSFTSDWLVDYEYDSNCVVDRQLSEAQKRLGTNAKNSMIAVKKYYYGDYGYNGRYGISGEYYTSKVHFMSEDESNVHHTNNSSCFDYYNGENINYSELCSRRKKRVTPNYNKHTPYGNYPLTLISESFVECSGEGEYEMCSEYIVWGYISENGFVEYTYDYFTSNIPYVYFQMNVALKPSATVDENMRILEST